jgi:TPR repeat protein
MPSSTSSSSQLREPLMHLKNYTNERKLLTVDSRSASSDSLEITKLWEREAKKAYPMLGKTLHKPDSQFRLGLRYLEGDEGFVKRDPNKAIYWITKAAENGEDKAQYTLGKMYVFGELVEKDVWLAKNYLAQSKKQGNNEAAKMLASIERIVKAHTSRN